jgi:hypothetical protein
MRLGQNPASSGTGCGEAWSEAEEARWIAEMRLPPAGVVERDDHAVRAEVTYLPGTTHGARHSDLGLSLGHAGQLAA